MSNNQSKENQQPTKLKVKLVQKNHGGEGPYYIGSGLYFGVQFEQLGEELIAEAYEKDIDSLIKAKKFKKLSANAYKELVDEEKAKAKEEEE